MTNRLAFARALLRTPAVLFLDEPTSGLDPTTVEAIHNMILAEKERGTTIFLTTHNMYEAEKLCDHIALLNAGKIVEFGAPDDICRRYNHQKKINIHLKNGQDIVLEHNKECGEKIKSYFLNEEIQTIHSTEPNLETIFMELTGRKFEI
ncbi:MAG: AAA family ATPase [Clostridiales bacterium]|nr:AAA family ATPase [Clostridiales bacterium]